MSYRTKNGPPKLAVLPFKLPYNLERQPKRHLHVPLCTNIRAGDLTEVAITVDCRNGPVGRQLGIAQRRIRLAELRRVGEVQSFRTELHPDPLSESEILKH